MQAFFLLTAATLTPDMEWLTVEITYDEMKNQIKKMRVVLDL